MGLKQISFRIIIRSQTKMCSTVKSLSLFSGCAVQTNPWWAFFEVFFEVHRGVPIYGKSVSKRLVLRAVKQLLVPIGCLEVFIKLPSDREIIYKCCNYRAPNFDGALR